MHDSIDYPAGVVDALLNILKESILLIRQAGNAGDADFCAAEANHVHHLPTLLRRYDRERLKRYLTWAQGPYSQEFEARFQRQPPMFQEEWKRLEEFLNERILEELLTVPLSDWKTNEIIGIGWNDGYTDGVCCLEKPACHFLFKEVAVEAPVPSSLHRLFRLYACPDDIVSELRRLIPLDADSEEPDTSMHPFHGVAIRWFPVASPEQPELDALLKTLYSQSIRSPFLVQSRWMTDFHNLWIVNDEEGSLNHE